MEIIHNDSFKEEPPSTTIEQRSTKASITCKLIPVFIATVAICTVGIWFGTTRDSGGDQVESTSAVVQGNSGGNNSTITTNEVDEDGVLTNNEELESYIIEDSFIEDELLVINNGVEEDTDEVIFIDASPVENDVVPTTPNIKDEQPVVDDEEKEITWNDSVENELFGSEVVVDGAEVENDMISVDGAGEENEIITWVDSEDELPVVDGGSEVVIEDELVEEGKVIEDSQPVQQEVVLPLPTTIVNTYTTLEQVNHDPTSFTQGLSYNTEGNIIFETTGLYGQSKIRRINAETYQVEKSINLSWQYFGEGSTYYTDSNGNGRLIMITWKSQTGWIYDSETLERLSEFQYTTTPALGNEGWGITYHSSNQEFIVSDGSQYLYFWDRDTLREKRKIIVTRFDGIEQSDLNELEMIDGLVCCNIWYEDVIICIDPVTGKSVREYGKCIYDAKCLIDIFKLNSFLDHSLSMNNRPVFIATERK